MPETTYTVTAEHRRQVREAYEATWRAVSAVLESEELAGMMGTKLYQQLEHAQGLAASRYGLVAI